MGGRDTLVFFPQQPGGAEGPLRTVLCGAALKSSVLLEAASNRDALMKPASSLHPEPNQPHLPIQAQRCLQILFVCFCF